ncbi:MAG: metal-dependent hydrolase [Rhodothermales bacterium]
MKITYHGHSAIQIEIGSHVIQVDPFITGNAIAESVVSADELEADTILLTHAHGDHWGDTPAIAKRTGATVVANYEITTYLGREHQYDNTVGMNIGGSWELAWGKVKQTVARHSSSFPDGTYGGNPNGYLLWAEGKCLYLAGDTDRFPDMQWIGDDNQIDIAFLPIGDCFTMGPAEAARAVEMLRPALAVPIHFNTFPAIETDADAWVEDLGRRGFKGRVMAPGETIEL